MPPFEIARVLDMRVQGELERMSDLARMVPLATSSDIDQSRGDAFKQRIDYQVDWARDLVESSSGLEDWGASSDRVGELVDELVTLVMTQLMRSKGLDTGTFDAASHLLHELVSRAGVPPLVLAHTDQFEALDHRRATVSLRFPGSRIWELPFIAHEFGHHATAQLRHREPAHPTKRPLLEVLSSVAMTAKASEQWNPQPEAHAAELLADCVATIVCGPTVPIACLCLRVPDQEKAKKSSATHPSWHDRIGAMRKSLDALSDKTGRERYRAQREQVLDPIAEAVLGTLPSPSAAGRQAALLAVTTVLQHRSNLVYGDADAAIDIEQRLGSREGTVPDGASVRAVMDGAWRWRLAQEDSRGDGEVAALAIDYCRQLGAQLTGEGYQS